MTLIIAVVLMVIGMIGNIMPGVPGNGLIFLSILGYNLFTHFKDFSTLWIIVFLILTIVSFVLDYMASLLGAKKFGATKAGIIGSVVGGIIGFFILNLLGMIIGQFIGALIGEFYGGKAFKESIHSGIGTLIGYVLGVVFNLSIGLIMIGLFLLKVIR